MTTIQPQGWDSGPRWLLHAGIDPRAPTAACSAIVSPRGAPPGLVPRAQANGPAEGERKEVGSSRFVLVVDDDPSLLEVTSFVIEDEGLTVATARDGKEALALLRTGRLPGLVLLDLMMPVMNGWEFLDEVAKDPALTQIPIVVLTAAEHVQVTGAVEVLGKPMDLKALLRVVKQYVRGDEDAGS
ncbi:MAG TPA: response regulator [Kofleriaceae bacterium]